MLNAIEAIAADELIGNKGEASIVFEKTFAIYELLSGICTEINGVWGADMCVVCRTLSNNGVKEEKKWNL